MLRSCALRLRSGQAVVGCVAVVLTMGGAAVAAPLDAAACDAASAEQSQLSDIPAVLERGPVWAKSNVGPATLKRVARWIELQEQLSFRCGRGRVTAEAQRAAAAAELIENPPQPPAPAAAVPATAVQGGEKPAVAKEVVAPAVAAPVASAPAPAAPASVTEAQTPKPKAAKAKPKIKPKSPPKDAQAAAETVAPVAAEPEPVPVPVPVPPKKKRVAKPVDAFVPAPAAPPQTN